VRSTLLHGLIPAGLRGKIWALEGAPIYRRSTLNQTMLNSHATVSSSLAAAADAGADLIMVDDASAPEALAMALRAGRTRVVIAGHAAGDLVSLIGETLDAGGPALVASTLRAAVAARPVRLLCPACKLPANGEAGAFKGVRTFTPAGCEACGFTGFKGRRLLTATWIADAETLRFIRTGQFEAVFNRVEQVGLQMREAGRALVLDGLVSADEFTRVAG
jgi:type II secretory ATPase GspE/PulE/Tfp pilus assembly ATPase PilB-like protein